MFYVFHGDDAFSRNEELASLTAKMGDPALAGLNTTYLEGRSTDLDELMHHCDTIPFMEDRRVVIVRGLLAQFKGDKALLKALVEYLPTMPDTTRLFLVEERELPKRHPVLKLAEQSQEGYAKTFAVPRGSQLVRWVQQRAQKAEAEIDRPTAEVLCTYVGDNLYQLYQEIEKLAAYTGRERPITIQDVQTLTSHARHANIFDMVDALGQRDGKTASRLYHDLLDSGDHPLALLGMIARQFRLMIQIKELAPQLGSAQAIARELRQNPYPVKKILSQSRHYSMEQLHTVYHQILETDMRIKTGRMEATLALDMLIAGLSRVA